MKAPWTYLRCWLGRHRRLDVIQTFGAAQHVGCPDCGREYAIHHGLRAFVPWDSDFEQLYTGMGFDVVKRTRQWRAYRSVIGHWAEDLSGSEQPPFRGWFYDDGYGYRAVSPEPTQWMPLPPQDGEQ